MQETYSKMMLTIFPLWIQITKVGYVCMHRFFFKENKWFIYTGK